MFRRFLILIISAALLCSTALAEVDLSGLTDQELKDLISGCSAELRKRAASSDPEGVLLFDQGGIRLYQTGDAFIDDSGRIKVPVTLFNDLEASTASLSPVFVVCNGVAVSGDIGPWIPPQSMTVTEMDFATMDVGLHSLDDVFSLVYQWQIYAAGEGVLLETLEREEHRFW